MISLKPYMGLAPPRGSQDVAVVTTVHRVADLDDGLGLNGVVSSEFTDDHARFGYAVTVKLLTREGVLTKVPYVFMAATENGFAGGIPIVGQNVIVMYIGSKYAPFAFGGVLLWRNIRQFIDRGRLPELKPGEVLLQSTIREHPMTVLDTDLPQEELTYLYNTPGARVYLDYKGRLICESKHYRSDGSDGAVVTMILGNPAEDGDGNTDEMSDFSGNDASSDSLIAMSTSVAPRPGESPLYVCNITQDGKVSFEFTKGWFGRSPSDADLSAPVTTVEIDVEGKQVIIDAESIVLGRGANQPAVLGTKLVTMMSNLVDLILGMRQPTAGPGGPTTSPPMNATQFIQLKQQLDSMLSQTNKVE